jgi:hypothetical protein
LTNGNVTTTKAIASTPAHTAILAAAVDPEKEAAPAAITIPSDFSIHSVDAKLDPRTKSSIASSVSSLAAASDPPLGVLEAFKGPFAGTGFNLIFRPNSAPELGGTTFPNPVFGNPIPQAPNENVLELNLTTETLTFSKSLGDVPNRGLEQQGDIHLNGVPYLQVINDVTNIDSTYHQELKR